MRPIGTEQVLYKKEIYNLKNGNYLKIQVVVIWSHGIAV
jgi:hypothetical protein